MKISIAYEIVIMLFFTNFIICQVDNDRKDYNNTESKIIFPKTLENEIQEIPVELLRRLNKLSSMEEFLKIMIDHSEPESLDIMERTASDEVERNALKSAKKANCMPELTTVSFNYNKTEGIIYYPPCTRVQRCSGCCLSDLDSCQPVETEIIPMTVIVAEYRGGQKLHLKETKIVEVEQHTKCKCDCKIRPQDCSKYQVYSPNKCRCECRNIDKESKCSKEAPKKIWDRLTCSCVCREELECGSGFEFDIFTCSCVSSRGRKKPSFIYEIN